MTLVRVQRATTATLSKQFYTDATAANAGTVTLSITASDGTPIVTSAATTGTGTAARTYALTALQTAQLDSWTLTWESSTLGTVTDTCEIVGGFVFSLAQARAMSGLNRQDNGGNYVVTNAQLVEARAEVERMLEHELGFAMVPRYTVETLSGEGGYQLAMKPYVRSVRSVSVDGAAWSPSDVAGLAFNPHGFLFSASRWTSGFSNITVGYEHGMDVPPPNAGTVALKLARSLIVSSPTDDRAATVSTDEQTTTFYVPGASEPFALPEANRFVQAHSLRTGIA